MNPLHKLTYGLYIIASKKGQKLNGYIANTAFQVTSDPPQIAISCHSDNLTTNYIRKSGVFSISVLAQDAGTELLQNFGYASGNVVDKFKKLNYKIGMTGAPIVLEDSIAWFDCKVKGSYEAGSHIVFFGEVMDRGLINDEKEVLTYDYYRNVKKAFAPEHAPTFINPAEGDFSSAQAGGEEGDSGEFVCVICAYVYDPAEGDPKNGIPPGTPFSEIPDDWICPVCRAGKEYFQEA
jgi:flavin reductase (DIM6/NTAB) family NADH-FMN oxidoreductase RutF/rubredoxin